MKRLATGHCATAVPERADCASGTADNNAGGQENAGYFQPQPAGPRQQAA